MKLYLLQVDMYDYDSELLDANSYCNIYSSFEKAKEQGINNLEERIKQRQEANIKLILLLFNFIKNIPN